MSVYKEKNSFILACYSIRSDACGIFKINTYVKHLRYKTPEFVCTIYIHLFFLYIHMYNFPCIFYTGISKGVVSFSLYRIFSYSISYVVFLTILKSLSNFIPSLERLQLSQASLAALVE